MVRAVVLTAATALSLVAAPARAADLVKPCVRPAAAQVPCEQTVPPCPQAEAPCQR